MNAEQRKEAKRRKRKAQVKKKNRTKEQFKRSLLKNNINVEDLIHSVDKPKGVN